MNSKMTAVGITAIMLTGILAFGITGCKSKAKETTETTVPSTQATTTTTTVPTTTLTVYSGPVANDEPITWNESQLEQPATYYAKVSNGEFLNVRKGPGVKYAKAGTLVRNQAVTVVARTQGGWYKTTDGYYVSQNFLVNAPLSN